MADHLLDADEPTRSCSFCANELSVRRVLVEADGVLDSVTEPALRAGTLAV